MLITLEEFFGLHVSPEELTWRQIAARTTTVFLFGVFLVRFAVRRFLGQSAGFDVLLVIVLGAVLSRAITGPAPFFETLGAALLLVILHRGIAAIACRWSAFSKFVKGDAIVLVRDGQVVVDALRATGISRDDLEENLRLNANTATISDVAEARLERNGRISVVKRAGIS